LDAEQAELRATQDEGQCEGVIEVVANVGVEDDELRGRRRNSSRSLRAKKLCGDKRCQRDEHCH
jgi:hypothetical protein